MGKLVKEKFRKSRLSEARGGVESMPLPPAGALPPIFIAAVRGGLLDEVDCVPLEVPLAVLEVEDDFLPPVPLDPLDPPGPLALLAAD